MSKSLEDRLAETEGYFAGAFEESFQVMKEKNRQRSDCWRGTGLIGQFVEIHSMYHRLRNLIWGQAPRFDDPVWKEQVHNALLDMRNFTVLAELCVEEANLKGDAYIQDSEVPEDTKIS